MPHSSRCLAPLLLCLAGTSIAVAGCASRPEAAPVRYPMSATAWRGERASFAVREGFPDGLMTVAGGYAALRRAASSQGTVEFDMKPLAYADTGILIHRRDADTAEFVYLRADPECPAANDCVQYAPVTNGRMQWNIYPQYQASAPISATGWNHLRLVVSGHRLRLFVNREREPALDVPVLQGIAEDGGIAVKGPAVFANLVVSPGTTGERPDVAAATRPAASLGQWSLGPATVRADQGAATFAERPEGNWRPLAAEPNGLLNLSRALPKNLAGGREVAWLRTTVDAEAEGDRVLDLGFASRAWLFVNGRAVWAGENFYYPVDRRLTPEGRLAPDNARIKVHLSRGRNELTLAVDDAWRDPGMNVFPTRYGWAAMARFEQGKGLSFTR